MPLPTGLLTNLAFVLFFEAFLFCSDGSAGLHHRLLWGHGILAEAQSLMLRSQTGCDSTETKTASSPFPWQEEEDLPYEEEIMRNQFSVKCWLRYIEFKQGAPKPRLNQLYERALKLLPCR